MGSENADGYTQNAETFLEQYNEDDDEFLNHIV
jgi:hypothetical protein